MDNNNITSLIDQIKSKLKDTNNISEVNEFKVSLLGKKGLINQKLSELKDLDPEQRKEKSIVLNKLKGEIASVISAKISHINEEKQKQELLEQRIDVTATPDIYNLGSHHVNDMIADFVKKIFLDLGWEVANAPIVDTDKNNFEDLNIAENHPARDMQDTFYLSDNELLRTHATNTTSQELKKREGEFAYVTVGKVFRRDTDDATHSHQFMQIDGSYVSKDANMSQLIGTLDHFAKKLFGEDLDTRIRPSYFPFTEPSIELDVECSNCRKEGCNKCKQSGWIEILGGGMLHPNVLENNGYDSSKYRGFAFGIGLERISILSYRINDIRQIYTNDLRFNKQFKMKKGVK